MTTRTATIVIGALIAVVIGAAWYWYGSLPDPIASHWNAAGEADGVMAKFWGLALFPLVMGGLFGLFLLIPVIDPLRRNIEGFRREFNIFFIAIIAFFTYLFALVLAWNFGARFPFGGAIAPALGALIFLIGVILPRTKRNWFFGIRTPWTLSSDRAWTETHRLGGRLFQIAGILAVGGAIAPSYAFVLAIGPLIAAVLILLPYSYIAYRRER